MEKQKTITFEWWNVEDDEIPEAHKEMLEDHATCRAISMSKHGYAEGQLSETIVSSDKEVEYEGWWSIKTGEVLTEKDMQALERLRNYHERQLHSEVKAGGDPEDIELYREEAELLAKISNQYSR